MSLSYRQQHRLRCMRCMLGTAEPRLASMLATFARLYAGEKMPARRARRAPRCRRSAGPVPAQASAKQRAVTLLAYLCGCLAALANASTNVMQRAANREESERLQFSVQLFKNLARRPLWLASI